METAVVILSAGNTVNSLSGNNAPTAASVGTIATAARVGIICAMGSGALFTKKSYKGCGIDVGTSNPIKQAVIKMMVPMMIKTALQGIIRSSEFDCGVDIALV